MQCGRCWQLRMCQQSFVFFRNRLSLCCLFQDEENAIGVGVGVGMPAKAKCLQKPNACKMPMLWLLLPLLLLLLPLLLLPLLLPLLLQMLSLLLPAANAMRKRESVNERAGERDRKI